MSNPINVPRKQVTRFELAMAKRLGLDPQIIDAESFSIEFVTDGDQAPVQVRLTALLPTDEVLAMFNGGGGATP